MYLAEYPSAENQITLAPMANREALKAEGAALDPLTVADGFGGFLSTDRKSVV